MPKPSGSGSATFIVRADAMAHGPTTDLRGSVDLSLERELGDGSTRLTIRHGWAIGNEHGGGDVDLSLRSPGAVYALVEALMQLMADQHGAQILATMDGS